MQITERFWLEGTFKYLVAKPLQCMGTSFTRSSRSHQCSCCKLATSAGIRLLIHFLHLQWHSPLSTESELHPPQKKKFFSSSSFCVFFCRRVSASLWAWGTMARTRTESLCGMPVPTWRSGCMRQHLYSQGPLLLSTSTPTLGWPGEQEKLVSVTSVSREPRS